MPDHKAYDKKLAKAGSYLKSTGDVPGIGCGMGTTVIHHAAKAVHIPATVSRSGKEWVCQNALWSVVIKSVTDQIEEQDGSSTPHVYGSIGYRVLLALEKAVGDSAERTAETGCGRSTVLFSNLSQEHHVFCMDDRDLGDASSVGYFQTSPLAKQERLDLHFGPTQQTLLSYEHSGLYDCVLIDGPHGYPFPELEYFHFYPHIREGGILIIDDLQIPTVGRMADVLREDAMWDFVTVVAKTGLFRRTGAEMTPPTGDHWWAQEFNQRRLPSYKYKAALRDGGEQESFAEYFARKNRKGMRKQFISRLLRPFGSSQKPE